MVWAAPSNGFTPPRGTSTASCTSSASPGIDSAVPSSKSVSSPKCSLWVQWVLPALYLLLFAVPLTAIAGAWLEGHPLTLLAGLQVAPQIAESHDLGVTISELHTWLGDAILWLAGLHAVAALYHHFFLKDGVLKSMLPG